MVPVPDTDIGIGYKFFCKNWITSMLMCTFKNIKSS